MGLLRPRGGIARGVARTAVVAGTASAVAGRVHHRQGERYAAQEQQAYEHEMYEQQQYAAPAAPAAPDTTAELQQIAQLHAQGILTDEEFGSGDFNQPIDVAPLPRDLEVLKFSPQFNHRLDHIIWPRGLKEVVLGLLRVHTRKERRFEAPGVAGKPPGDNGSGGRFDRSAEARSKQTTD